LPYREARDQAPRATSLAQADPFFYEKYNPGVLVNYMDELDNPHKGNDNFKFRAPLLVDAGGFQSNLVKSFHKQRTTNVWKCIVYEFDNLPRLPEDIIWDLAVPTMTSANFWVDVFSEKKAAAGVMVLTKTSPTLPYALPPKSELGRYMSTWLNIRKISGTIIRERYGFIPMADFREPAAYDNIIFIGACASRQVPNVGYGVLPALEEAQLCADSIKTALEKKKFDKKMLRTYDIAWLKKFESRMILQKVFQDLHYAYETDEYFNEFAEKCTSLSSDVVRRAICNEWTKSDLRKIGRLFIRNAYLLDRHHIDPAMYPELLRDCATLFYCNLAGLLHCYCPWGNRMFRNDPLHRSWPLSWLFALFVFTVRSMPEWIFRQCARLLFRRTVQAVLRLFAPRHKAA
jgi:hypothetical protein